jgi:hypothetical protein
VKKLFYVWGGLFRDSDAAWSPEPKAADLIGPLEFYGPFENEADAERAWLGGTRRSVDSCAHRLIVASLTEDEAPAWVERLRMAAA